MEAFAYFISIIWSIIWAIFCLILLFKIWGMCNDVSKIKNHIVGNEDYSTKIKFLLSIGEKEKAKEILIAKVLSDESIFNLTSTPVEKMEELYNKYHDEFDSLGIEIDKE